MAVVITEYKSGPIIELVNKEIEISTFTFWNNVNSNPKLKRLNMCKTAAAAGADATEGLELYIFFKDSKRDLPVPKAWTNKECDQ
jgi:hypothetical protein